MDNINALIPYSEVENKIAVIRKQDVIADADVAELYGVETREVNQAVRNNPDKFPKDYMFELTKRELSILRSKILTTNVSNKSRSATKVFTEKGLYMLATILKSDCHHRDLCQSAGVEARVGGVAQGDRQGGTGEKDEPLRRSADRNSDARPRDLRDGIIIGDKLYHW